MAQEKTQEKSVAALVARIPEPDKPEADSKATGPEPELARKTAVEVIEGGRESLLELIGLAVRAAGAGAPEYRPGYLLHCVALEAGAPGREAYRKLFAETLASRLGGAEPAKEAQAVLLRELQTAGGPEVIDALGKLLADSDLCQHAVLTLAAIGGTAAAEKLRAALPAAKGRDLLAILQALGRLRDPAAQPALRDVLMRGDAEARVGAAWALAPIADAQAADALLAAAGRAEGWERIQLTDACLVLAEGLKDAGKTAESRRVYLQLRDGRKDDSERHIVEAARRGLGQARV